MQKAIRVRCYAEKETDGSWFAICLDLNLYARADSYQEARRSLESIVHQYVTEAFGCDREHFDDLVPRRAPARFWFRYYSIALQRWLSGRPDDRPDGHAVRFMEQMPLHA